jgi:hypothetical protein
VGGGEPLDDDAGEPEAGEIPEPLPPIGAGGDAPPPG